MDVAALQQALARFADERDWEQFHSPKNLASALAVEAAELLEIFQWLTEAQSRDLREDPTRYARARDEIADVQIYLLRLSDQLDVDLEAAVEDKLAKNADKYPAHLARGNARKYDEL